MKELIQKYIKLYPFLLTATKEEACSLFRMLRERYTTQCDRHIQSYQQSKELITDSSWSKIREFGTKFGISYQEFRDTESLLFRIQAMNQTEWTKFRESLELEECLRLRGSFIPAEEN